MNAHLTPSSHETGDHEFGDAVVGLLQITSHDVETEAVGAPGHEGEQRCSASCHRSVHRVQRLDHHRTPVQWVPQSGQGHGESTFIAVATPQVGQGDEVGEFLRVDLVMASHPSRVASSAQPVDAGAHRFHLRSFQGETLRRQDGFIADAHCSQARPLPCKGALFGGTQHGRRPSVGMSHVHEGRDCPRPLSPRSDGVPGGQGHAQFGAVADRCPAILGEDGCLVTPQREVSQRVSRVLCQQTTQLQFLVDVDESDVVLGPHEDDERRNHCHGHEETHDAEQPSGHRRVHRDNARNVGEMFEQGEQPGRGAVGDTCCRTHGPPGCERDEDTDEGDEYRPVEVPPGHPGHEIMSVGDEQAEYGTNAHHIEQVLGETVVGHVVRGPPGGHLDDEGSDVTPGDEPAHQETRHAHPPGDSPALLEGEREDDEQNSRQPARSFDGEHENRECPNEPVKPPGSAEEQREDQQCSPDTHESGHQGSRMGSAVTSEWHDAYFASKYR